MQSQALVVPELDLDKIEQAMVQAGEPIEILPVHYFADGIYAREITIPKGTILTGKIHKTRHLNVISKGRIAVWSPGEPVRLINAPFTFVAHPGTRRLGLAHEETVWTTIHATDETDLDRLEDQLIEPHDNPYLSDLLPSEEIKCLG